MYWFEVFVVWWRLLSLGAGVGLGIYDEPVCSVTIFLRKCKVVWVLDVHLSAGCVPSRRRPGVNALGLRRGPPRFLRGWCVPVTI